MQPLHILVKHVSEELTRSWYAYFWTVQTEKKSIFGLEVSGIIEGVGRNVQSLKAGDKAIALTGFGLGGYAEYGYLLHRICYKIKTST